MSDKKCGLFARRPLNVESPTATTILIEDKDFALMALNKLDIEEALRTGRIKGNVDLGHKLRKIFQSPIIQSKL